MPKAKLVDHIFLAQFKPPPPIPLFPLPPLISTTNKVTFARNWRHTEVQNTTFVYNIFKFSRDTGILDLWDKNIPTRKEHFALLHTVSFWILIARHAKSSNWIANILPTLNIHLTCVRIFTRGARNYASLLALKPRIAVFRSDNASLNMS